MTRLEAVWAALKAEVSAVILLVAVGFLFAGADKAMVWLFLDYCTQTGSGFCSIPRFWTAWWWATFLILAYPLFIALLAIFIRKFARPGYRLASAGFLFIFHGFWMTFDGFSAVANGSSGALLVMYIAVGAVLLSVGLYFGLRRVASA